MRRLIIITWRRRVTRGRDVLDVRRFASGHVATAGKKEGQM